MEHELSNKSYGASVALCMIFGVVGVHHFYLGNWVHGLFDFSLFVVGFWMIFFGGPGLMGFGILLILIDALHTIIVTYLLFVGKFKDGKGRLIAYPGQHK